MKLTHFWHPEKPQLNLGLARPDGILDLGTAVGLSPADLREAGLALLPHIQQGLASQPNQPLLDPNRVLFAPCVYQPEKIICIGLNYARHAREGGKEVPETPVLFSKFNNALAAPGEVIPLPQNCREFDYEVELGVVIGRTTRYVSPAEALDCVLGYCTLNDLSVRDLQMRTSQWLLGKTLDKFMPTGETVVTADEIPNPQNLRLRSWVNGDLRQDSNTADMIFTVADIISYISQYMTLEPGDLISTGTPEGVVLGRPQKDWLTAGDEVTVRIDGLGGTTNQFINEQ